MQPYLLATNSLGRTVKVPTKCVLAVKHLSTLAGMPYSAHSHTAQEMSAQPIVQYQMMSQYHLSPYTSRRRMERSVEEEQCGQLGVEWVDPKEFPLISVDTLRKEEQDHSCSEGSNKTCISSNDLGTFDWHAIRSACVQGLRNFSWHHKWRAKTKQLPTKDGYNRSAPHVSLVRSS